MNETVQIVVGVLQGIGASTLFVLGLFIGFCIIFGFTKLKKTAGGNSPVIKSLDERLSGSPMQYLSPSAPRGPADQLKAPELVEAAARRG